MDLDLANWPDDVNIGVVARDRDRNDIESLELEMREVDRKGEGRFLGTPPANWSTSKRGEGYTTHEDLPWEQTPFSTYSSD